MSRPSTPPPGAVAAAEDDDPLRLETLHTEDGVELVWRLDHPAGPARALLVFVHGLAEHGGRYRHVVEHFRSLGLACCRFDLRGHGRSSGRRVHVQSFDDYGLDVAAVLEQARAATAGLPTFLVGHSMGGVVAIRAALDHPEILDGLVLSSPGLAPHADTAPPAWLAAIAKGVSVLVPGMLFPTDLDAAAISRDPEVVAAYRADPLVSDCVSARWFTAYQAARRDAVERAGELQLPALVMQSGADRLVDPAATRRWADAAPSDLVQFHVWPELFHEMFNEADNLRVFERVERWLDERLGSP